MFVNDELERLWKEVVMASFKYCPNICLKWLGKPMKIICQGRQSPGQYLNIRPPEY